MASAGQDRQQEIQQGAEAMHALTDIAAGHEGVRIDQRDAKLILRMLSEMRFCDEVRREHERQQDLEQPPRRE